MKWVNLALLLVVILGIGYFSYTQIDSMQQAKKVRQIEAERIAKQQKAKQEKAAKLAEEKRLQDEAEKKRIAEEQKKNLFIDENLKLQPQINNAKNLIESANYDKGQTFGKHLDELKNSFDSAMLALDKYPDKANKFLKKAQNEIEWIQKNVPLRQMVQKLQKQTAAKKSEADKFNGAKLAYIAYSTAEKDVKKAEKDYEAGDFRTAATMLNIAISNYEKAYTEARETTIKNLLDSSKLAAQSEQWQKSFDHAESVLKIDSGNSEAQKLKQEAENNLKPTLEITALLDGREVSAEITDNYGKKYSANVIKDLTEQKKYTFNVLYKHSDGNLFGGNISLTADWKGLQKKQINLEEYFDLDKIAADEKLGFEFSDDKRTLQKAPKNISGKYIIPAGVQTIGEMAFQWCKNLQSVTIPDSVQTIGEEAFQACGNLRSVTIPDSVQTICGGAFWYCGNLRSVTIPDSVQIIGNSAFYDCDNLQSVTIGNGVQIIGSSAFSYCRNLKSVTIGNSVQTIGERAFEYCKNLQSVTIPDSVQTIGNWAFGACSNLQSVTIPRHVKLAFNSFGSNTKVIRR